MSTQPLMVDLFCGKGGWTNTFLDQGWLVRGYDLVQFPEYRGEFVYKNLMHLRVEEIADADFVCCSSPCEEFSVFGMRHFHPNPPQPKIGLKLFIHCREVLEASGKPYVMENVRRAQDFVGQAVICCGPFALWGPGVPPLIPQGITKGYKMDRATSLARHDKRAIAAKMAVIPDLLARAVCDYASYLRAKKVLDNSASSSMIDSERGTHGNIDSRIEKEQGSQTCREGTTDPHGD